MTSLFWFVLFVYFENPSSVSPHKKQKTKKLMLGYALNTENLKFPAQMAARLFAESALQILSYSSSQRLEDQRELLCKSQSMNRRKPMFQLKLSGRKSKFSTPLLFVLIRSSTNWMIPTHTGEGKPLCSVY